MDQYINILWTSFDAVYDWCIKSYSAFDLDFNSIIIGMLCVSLIIGYILSPYLRNPVPSASTIRDRENARERSETARAAAQERYEQQAARISAYRRAMYNRRFYR